MATKQITTWAEFKTALTETITENTTYEIMNDIDVSDTVISSEIVCADSFAWKYFQPANGVKSVKINGITSYMAPSGAGGIIRMSNNTYLRFRHIQFSNLMLARTYLFAGYTGQDSELRLEDCLFNGVVKCLCYKQYSDIIITGCSINLKCDALSRRTPTCNNCWVHIEPLSETNQLIIDPDTTITIGSNNYFEGILRRTSGIIGGYSAPLPGRALNNVFNFDIVFTNNPTNVTISILDLLGEHSAPEKSSLINISKIKNANDTTPTVSTTYTAFPYLLTDSQLKSKTYIQKNTNFPLYG